MLFSPFAAKDSSMPAPTNVRTHEAAAQSRGLKKWLSMKVSSGHRQSTDPTSISSPIKVRYSVGMLPSAHNGKKPGHTSNAHGGKKPATKAHRLRSRLSLPVTQRLQRKGAGGYGHDARHASGLPTILEFGLDSPIPSPESALTPPPTIESDSGKDVDISDMCAAPYYGFINAELLHLQNEPSDDNTKDSERPGKQRPPLRKRSLIYAMYCTAQSDVESDQSGMQSTSGSVVSANNGSATFVSCISLPNMCDDQVSVCSTSPQHCQMVISPEQYSQNQQASDMSIGFMVVDAVEHLAAARRQRLGVVDSDACSDCSTSSDSSTGSRYIGAKCMVVEAEAYRCNSKYAPRLSTVERAHDGRLLLKPHLDASVDVQKVPDSGNTSTAEASPYPDAAIALNGSPTKDASDYIRNVCLDNFPPIPQASPLRQTIRKPVNSLLIHATKLGTDISDEPASCQSLELFTADLVLTEPTCLDTLPAGSSSPVLLATPLESPVKSNAATASTSVVSTVSADNSAADSSEASTASPDKEDSTDRCSETPAEGNIGAADKHNASDKNSTSERAVSCTEDNSETDCHAAAGPQPASSLQFNRGELQAGCQSPSYDSMTQLTDSTCGDSRLYSMFSDISDIDLRSLDPADLSQAPGGPWTNQSLLFGGCYNDTMRPHALAFSDAPIPPQLDTRISASGSDSIGNSTLDNMPLAQVAALVPATAVQRLGDQQLGGQQRSPTPSKTRRLTSALAKAAQLDGFRHLHRKTKTADRNGRYPAGLRRNSGSSSSNASSSSKITGKTRESSPQSARSKTPTKKSFRFNELVAVYETWNRDEYDRRGIPATRLNAELIEQIKQELNDYKAYEMQVHEASRQLTHFIY